MENSKKIQSTKYPDNYKYTLTHEWVFQENNIYTIGITEFAAQQLGDIVFIELPEVGREVKVGDEVAVIESVKAASDIYAPLRGKIIAVNTILQETPEKINQNAYDLQTGWIYKIEGSNIPKLLTAEQYEASIK